MSLLPTLTGLTLGGVASILENKLPKKTKLPFTSGNKLTDRIKSQWVQNKVGLAKAVKTPPKMSPAEAAHQQMVALSAVGLFIIGAITTPVIAWLGLPLLGSVDIKKVKIVEFKV